MLKRYCKSCGGVTTQFAPFLVHQSRDWFSKIVAETWTLAQAKKAAKPGNVIHKRGRVKENAASYIFLMQIAKPLKGRR
jgi:hypothetical protein